MNILGISAFYHDSAACLVQDGIIVSAVQEERFTRKKHDPGFPSKSIDYCLNNSGLTIQDIDFIAYYEKPFLKFERILESYMQYAPFGISSFIKAMPGWIKKKVWIKDIIRNRLGYNGEIIFTEHHESHAASAFFPSPFQESAFLTMDGVGEWSTTSYGIGKGNNIEILADIQFPHSIGLLYSAFTYFAGFRVNSGEYKLMGLAPYGDPIFKDLILDKLVDLKEDGSFHLNTDYFDFMVGLKMTNSKFASLFGGPRRVPESEITQREMNLAASVQKVVEEIVLKTARHIYARTGQKYLCLAGGVALNCVANGRLLEEGPFEDIWVQPASGDSGGALGAALFVWHQYLENERIADDINDFQMGSYLGPEFSDDDIRTFLEDNEITYSRLTDDSLFDTVSELLASENVVGWMRGRMEFGPRALGARSIIGDARSDNMQRLMNLKIKFRESFRPFAPSVLAESVSDYFKIDRPSPYMLMVAPVQDRIRMDLSSEHHSLSGIDKLNVARSLIPAVTHVDYSARVQTVHRETNPSYHALLSRFSEKTGCPVLINTSFNVRGEPIVCTIEDSFRCFMQTNIDYLVIGNYLLSKSDQKVSSADRFGAINIQLD